MSASIGQTVFYYADHGQTKGMRSNDTDKPFAAIVADVVSERVVNLLVIDHTGVTFPCASVAVFVGDDDDDKSATSHCELKAREEVEEPDAQNGHAQFDPAWTPAPAESEALPTQ